jgi:hypothetical protein
MTIVDKLRALYRDKAANGLLDVKFDIDGRPGVERVAEEVMRLEAAVERGEFVPLLFGDRKAPREGETREGEG